MSVLVISLPPGGGDAETPAGWALVSDDGAIRAEGAIRPGEAPDWPNGESPDYAVALLPAQDMFARYRAVPGRSERDAAQAAPFLVEEELAAPLETQHVVPGARDADGRAWLFAAAKPVQQGWRDYLAGLGVKPVYAAPDAMFLSGHGGDLTVAAYDDVVLFQTRGGDLVRQARLGDEAEAAPDDDPVCGGVERDLADAVLPALGARLNPQRVLLTEDIAPERVAPDAEPVAVKRQPAPDLRVEAARAPEAALVRLPAFFGTALVSGVDWASMIRPWTRAGALLGVAVIGASALFFAEGVYYSQRADRYYEASREMYRAEFDERATDPAAQLRVKLRALGGGPGESAFLELAARLAEAAGEADQVRIDSIRYSAERDGLSVTATYPDFADFEAFRTMADEAGLVIEDGGARQGPGGVTGDFLVRRP
ncbi:hypothetical protein DDZ18_10450 [Marinicauda salina]|uniref:GspL cytoplasmic actin-ATPase-like domain-containing protein n=1 Tax=Marinicauda salina TaxID=2135793 RepID=A0A2U2BSZ1_9PROT|nr:type II secretion system protein GspL [Marinicauda salina]PWE17110.1 hypothetical protein DDZ18_10450 [Marinicauda salina]